MIAAMAQWEREEIADRVSASMAIRAKLGKPLSWRLPYGYTRAEGDRIVPHPQEAPVRKLMYELYLQHRRKKRVIRLLNEAGYRTREGHLWSDTSLERLLRDSTAKGLYRANHSKRAGDGRGFKPPEEWVWTEVEPIISEEVWEQCNRLLDANHQHQRRGKLPVQPFAGLTHCHCGRKMYVPSNTPKYVCQGCRNKIPIVDLEAVFVEQLKGFFLSPEEVAAHLAQADESIAEKEQLLTTLQGEQEKVEQEVQWIYRLYTDGGLTAEGFGKFYRPLEERQKQLGDEVPRLQAELDVLKINHLSGDKILSEAKDLHGRWPRLNQEEKQRIIESITEKIVIGTDDEISITLCYLPSSEELTKEQRKLPPPSRSTRTPTRT
jgi:site-specific DNA recombinase